ncbi:MAG TPA: EAL domain-containing protein [Burkholderiaceae bacterium]|jgi:diguanylate cyclase (GGDEF)-like protein/PAS domain S-box-containing protein
MKTPLLHSGETITTNEIFRLASLFLYIILLLHIVLAAATQHISITAASALAISLLTLLFFVALGRYVWPQVVAYGQSRILFEMAVVIAVIGLLTLRPILPSVPLPWLIGVAGVFPLALGTGIALTAVVSIGAIGLGLNAQLGMPLNDWLPNMYATLFVGLLATLLAKALNTNTTALSQAYKNERRFDAIARATRHIFMIVDAKYKIMYANPALQEVIGYTLEEIKTNNINAVIHPDDVEEHNKKLRYLRDTPQSSIFSRHRTQHKDGHWIWVETSGYNMLHDDAINGLVFSIEDINARKDAERKLAEEHTLLRAVLDLNPSMIYAKDTEGRFTISNLSYQRRFGYTSEDSLRGKTAYEVFLKQASKGHEIELYDIADELHRQDLQVIQTGEPLEDLEIQGIWESDMRSWYRTNKYPLRDANDNIVGVLGITRDVTDRKEYEMRLEYQALHDSLTGLPNRRFLLKAITETMAASHDKHSRLALLFCDLDFFKSVNDMHGHDFGDKCLLELTRRILAELPADDFVARFGGNEFVVLTNASMLEARTKAEMLLQAVSRQLIIDDIVVKIQTSIGIVLQNPEHKNPSDLIRDADAAMYQAKERGRNRAEIFDATLQNNATKRAQMDAALRFALERNELSVVYQPKVSMIDGTVKGFELLLRWDSPVYGSLSPTEFIPIAETSGVIVSIGLWVLREACKQLNIWQEKYPIPDLTIAVNVSMRQLLQSSFLSDVTTILENTGVSPSSIELELTETSAMANPLQTIENLSMLKRLGLRLALDDFGTGYSSLAYLQKLPIDVLKIDKAFVHGLGKNPSDAEIVRLILALAQTLNLETVAEGVETPEHMLRLKKMGCYLGQGYAFSQAISAAEAEELLRHAQPFILA